jgi:heat shock protein HslJ
VKDAQGDPVQGRTKWRRFAAVLIPTAVATGAIVFGMANGAIAAQFTVSGQQFKVSADRLDGTKFAQFGGLVRPKGQNYIPVATSVIGSADLTNLCQSVKVASPVPVSMIIRAGRVADRPVHATNLVIDMNDLRGNATFKNINIGQDAGDITGNTNLNNFFGQAADEVHIANLKQVALSTTAGSFALTDMHLYLDAGSNSEECFADNPVK